MFFVQKNNESHLMKFDFQYTLQLRNCDEQLQTTLFDKIDRVKFLIDQRMNIASLNDFYKYKSFEIQNHQNIR